MWTQPWPARLLAQNCLCLQVGLIKHCMEYLDKNADPLERVHMDVYARQGNSRLIQQSEAMHASAKQPQPKSSWTAV